jgi:hypothetical protein
MAYFVHNHDKFKKIECSQTICLITCSRILLGSSIKFTNLHFVESFNLKKKEYLLPLCVASILLYIIVHCDSMITFTSLKKTHWICNPLILYTWTYLKRLTFLLFHYFLINQMWHCIIASTFLFLVEEVKTPRFYKILPKLSYVAMTYYKQEHSLKLWAMFLYCTCYMSLLRLNNSLITLVGLWIFSNFSFITFFVSSRSL